MRSGALWPSRAYWKTSWRQVWNHAGRESRVWWETTGRQAWNHADQSAQSIQSALRDKWGQVRDKWERNMKWFRQRIQGVAGDKWETSAKSGGLSTESIQGVPGDKWETSGGKWETSMKWMYWETETSGRQVWNHSDQSTQRILSVSCRR